MGASSSIVQRPILPRRDIAKIRVGEHTFTASRSLLSSTSPLFRTLFKAEDTFRITARYPNTVHDWLQPDGTYFLDMDGSTFQHVLAWIRHRIVPDFREVGRTEIGPPRWDTTRYEMLEAQARVLGIEELRLVAEARAFFEDGPDDEEGVEWEIRDDEDGENDEDEDDGDEDDDEDGENDEDPDDGEGDGQDDISSISSISSMYATPP